MFGKVWNQFAQTWTDVVILSKIIYLHHLSLVTLLITQYFQTHQKLRNNQKKKHSNSLPSIETLTELTAY